METLAMLPNHYAGTAKKLLCQQSPLVAVDVILEWLDEFERTEAYPAQYLTELRLQLLELRRDLKEKQ